MIGREYFEQFIGPSEEDEEEQKYLDMLSGAFMYNMKLYNQDIPKALEMLRRTHNLEDATVSFQHGKAKVLSVKRKQKRSEA